MKLMEKNFSNGCYVKDISPYDNNLESILNNNEDIRVNIVTKVAAISRGNTESKNPIERYKKLLKEAAPNIDLTELKDGVKFDKVAGRPLEFAPVKLKVTFPEDDNALYYINTCHDGLKIPILRNAFLNKIMPFSYIEGNTLYTNIRTLVNAGIEYGLIPYTKVNNFRIVEVKAPYFVFAQIRTHGKLSQIAVSERVVKEDEYWLPEGALKQIKFKLTKDHIEDLNLNCDSHEFCKFGYRIHEVVTQNELIDIFLEMPIGKVKDILKIAGYHKEIYDRWPNHLKFKRWIMGGYMNDPKQWPHFLLEREAFENNYKSWVQETTKETAINIKEVIYE